MRKYKENYEWKKVYLNIIKKQRMENSQDGDGKNKSSTNIYISTNNITELNELIYSLWENWNPLKKYKEKIKT